MRSGRGTSQTASAQTISGLSRLVLGRVSDAQKSLPYPESLCHRCAAPPKLVETKTSTFIMCPLLPEKYPRQPVVECPLFRPREEG